MAESANRNLVVRIVTAVVLVPLILWILYVAPPWAFFLLTTTAGVVGTREFFEMTHKGDRVTQTLGILLSVAIAAALFFAPSAEARSRVLLVIVVVAPLLGPLFTLARLGDIATAAVRAFALSVGPLFVMVPLTLLALMRRDFGAGTNGPGFVVVSLMFAWGSDTGGYFAGRFLGKHKLYPAVSPKKTVEGAMGGLFGAMLGACLASFWYLPSLPIQHSIPLALVAGALGQAGDLAESLIKRSVGVKDSGAILPGHGGMLDRIDALVVTSSIVFLYGAFFRP